MATSGWGAWESDILVDDPQSAGDDYVAVAEVRTLSQTIANDRVDMTSRDSNRWKESILSFGEMTVPCEGVKVDDDPGQDKLRDAAVNKTSVSLRVRVRGATSGYDYYQGTFLVDSFGDSLNHDDRVSFTFNLVSTGVVQVLQNA